MAVFKIVPMLNPDGVVNGNYRCSLAGVDLNRTWMEPSRKLHPTINNTKLMIKKFMEDREVCPRTLFFSFTRRRNSLRKSLAVQVVLFCDLHGHSRKKDIFLYGCTKGSKVFHALSVVFLFSHPRSRAWKLLPHNITTTSHRRAMSMQLRMR